MLNNNFIISDARHRRLEPVAVSGNGHEIFWIVALFAERLAKRRNLDREIRFFNDLTRPDLRQNLVLAQQPATVLKEHQQQVEGLRWQRDFMSVMQQLPVRHVELEVVETINLFWCFR